MQKNNYKYAAALLLFYGLLCLHTGILYSGKLPPATIALQALYRWLVGTIPLFLTLWLAHSQPGKIRVLLLVLWVFFIPYPFYNFFQLRHIAEIFTHRNSLYLTQSSSITQVWKILPTALYAFSQLVLFYYCLHKISLKPLAAVGIGVFAAACTAYGLSVRLDTFHLITNPATVLNRLLLLLANGAFILNFTVILVFCLLGYFISCLLVKAIKKAPLQ